MNQGVQCNEGDQVADGFSSEEPCLLRENFQYPAKNTEESCGPIPFSPHATFLSNQHPTTVGIGCVEKSPTILSLNSLDASPRPDEDPSNVLHFPPPSFSLGEVADGSDVPEGRA